MASRASSAATTARHRGGLRRRQRRTGRPRARAPRPPAPSSGSRGRSRVTSSTRPAAGEPGQARRRRGARRARRRGKVPVVQRGQLGEQGSLARAERPAVGAAGLRPRPPARPAWRRTRRSYRGRAPAAPSVHSRWTRPARSSARRRRSTAGRLSAPGSARTGRGPVARASRRAAVAASSPGSVPVGGRRHQVEALEEPGREHRPDRQGRRREVVLGDPAREGEREGRQERAVGPDPRGQRLRPSTPSGGGRVAQHDPDARAGAPTPRCTASPGSTSARASGTTVGPGSIAGDAGRVDRDLDVARLGRAGRAARPPSPDAAVGPGARRQTTTRRSGWRARSARMIASIRSAVRSTWPSSLTTTWS